MKRRACHTWDAAHWWRQDGSAKFVLFEYLKLAYYRVRGLQASGRL
jgi:hypothetical protein